VFITLCNRILQQSQCSQCSADLQLSCDMSSSQQLHSQMSVVSDTVYPASGKSTDFHCKSTLSSELVWLDVGAGPNTV
jgi:hypothetical protein